jgi:hypothetical protein
MKNSTVCLHAVENPALMGNSSCSVRGCSVIGLGQAKAAFAAVRCKGPG